MEDKFRVFFLVAKKLNALGVEPVLFGSLGVSTVINLEMPINDVDILIPDIWVEDRWRELIVLMSALDFSVYDELEHEFIRDSQKVAFAGESILGDISLTKSKLVRMATGELKYYIPTASQFLEIYRYSLNDGYRIKKRKDNEKIKLLTEYLKRNENNFLER